MKVVDHLIAVRLQFQIVQPRDEASLVVMGEEAYMVGGIGQSSVEVMRIMMMAMMLMMIVMMLLVMLMRMVMVTKL